tara:strand:+ start:176 stop:430 length:255 start_codon:yes stop_codon:yes gene_type:complete
MPSLLNNIIREVEETTSEEELTTKFRLVRAIMLIIALLGGNPTISPTAQQDHHLPENNQATLEFNTSRHKGEMGLAEDDLNIRF